MSSTSEEKLLAVLGGLEKKIDQLTTLHIETRVMADNNHKEILGLRTKVTSLEKENKELRKELIDVKEIVNRREQQARELTIRVLGLPVSEEEKKEGGRSAIKQVYDRLLKPILTVAKGGGLLESVPQFNTCVEEGYRVGWSVSDAKGKPLPPPIIIKLKSKAIKSALFRCKKDALPESTEAEKRAGARRILIVEDLTKPTLTKMKELKEDKRVEKVWTVEGTIKFTLVGKPNEIIKLNSAFKPLAEILK